MKDKYCLSPYYEFLNTQADEVTSYQVKLLDKRNDEILLINKTIADFLSFFEKPATLQDMLTFLQKETQENIKQIKPVVKDFFDSMVARGLLILESDLLKIQNLPKMPNEAGQWLDSYFLQKQLTQSPPVAIYLATDSRSAQYIVKKIYFLPEYPQKYQKQERQQFAHEFKILQQLRGCKQIVQLVELNTDKNYAVIEYFEGMSIRKRIETIKPSLTINDKIEIYRQVLEAIAFAHSQKIIHGDLHYSNILINTNNEIKVIDFDLALHSSELNDSSVMRGGIKDFLPPERIDFNAFEIFNDPPDFRAEVFQIGVLGYFIFYENLPFKGNTWKALAKNIIESEPSWTNPRIPVSVINLLKKSLSKNPDKRFQSVEEMYEVFKIASSREFK
jgi:serine/threonine protein kinase